MTVTLVTGANSGIGRATALHLATLGHTVYGAMRDPARGDKLASLADAAGVKVHPVALDVSDDESVAAGVRSVLDEAGTIDVLVNNAGVGYNACTEDIDIETGQAVFDVNFWGLVRCIKAVVPTMREQRSGVVVNVSSVTGQIAALAQTVYASSKWAVECMSENLAQEVAPWGIRVKIIEPGVTRTAILPKNVENPSPTAYADAYRRLEAFYAAGIAANVQAEVVAASIAEAIADDSARLRYVSAWAGPEIVDRRPSVSDAEWVALGAAPTDDEYFDRFEAAFGLDIRPG